LLNRLFLLIVLLSPGTARIFGARDNQLDGNPALFSVMAALQAAGFAPNGSVSPVGLAVQNHVAARNLQVVSELTNFVATHRKPTLAADLAQYVSFALSVSDPPEFKSKFQSGEVPPDVVALEGFDKLMVRFYKDAGLEDIWLKVQPALNETLARYQEPVSRTIFEATGYLRNPTSGYMGRHFQVYLELLGRPGQVQTRSYGDEYYIVLTPAPEPQTDEIRHAYLHYLMDPLAIKFSEQVNKKRSLEDYALGAPILDEFYKADFLLLTVESLIKAIESRLLHGPLEKKQALVQQALEEGFVLTPYFAEALPAYEKQEVAMRLYFPDMISAIDLKKESSRLEKVKFATVRPERKMAESVSLPAPAPVLSPAAKSLETAEQLYSERKLEKAGEAYRQVLQQTEDKPLHARTYYGLARIAALQRDPELAEKLFRKTLELTPDSQTRAWAEVYLGRLADASGEREQAVQHYQAALAIKEASSGAKQAAEQGLKNKFQK
jgi:tetratricopeptide (TPR) repeat protein